MVHILLTKDLGFRNWIWHTLEYEYSLVPGYQRVGQC